MIFLLVIPALFLLSIWATDALARHAGYQKGLKLGTDMNRAFLKLEYERGLRDGALSAKPEEAQP